LLYHDCVRGNQRISLADFERDNAENDSAGRPRAVDWIWRDAAGVVCGRDGDGGCCAMQPGVYFAINSPAGVVGTAPDAVAATISGWGYHLDPQTRSTWRTLGRADAFNRAGGAPSLAVAWRRFFSSTIGGERLMSIWYHFAIMFEALFILTVLDAGTRVGRFMCRRWAGACGNRSAKRAGCKRGDFKRFGGVCLGVFLYQGVIDPFGGINFTVPLFGIANQLLARWRWSWRRQFY